MQLLTNKHVNLTFAVWRIYQTELWALLTAMQFTIMSVVSMFCQRDKILCPSNIG
jgi:hypothetical protein